MAGETLIIGRREKKKMKRKLYLNSEHRRCIIHVLITSGKEGRKFKERVFKESGNKAIIYYLTLAVYCFFLLFSIRLMRTKLIVFRMLMEN